MCVGGGGVYLEYLGIKSTLFTVHHSFYLLPWQVMHEYTALENFWKRYNKVLLDKLAMDRGEQTLEDENSKLKSPPEAVP